MLLDNFPCVDVNTPVGGGGLSTLGIAAWAGDRATATALLRHPHLEPSHHGWPPAENLLLPRQAPLHRCPAYHVSVVVVDFRVSLGNDV